MIQGHPAVHFGRFLFGSIYLPQKFRFTSKENLKVISSKYKVSWNFSQTSCGYLLLYIISKNAIKKKGHPAPRKSCDPLKLPNNCLLYSLSNRSLFDQFLPCFFGNRNYIDKVELSKTWYIECMKHKQQLKINFLTGKRKMKHYWAKTFLACVSQYHYFMPASGGKACISGDDSFFCRQFFSKYF